MRYTITLRNLAMAGLMILLTACVPEVDTTTTEAAGGGGGGTSSTINGYELVQLVTNGTVQDTVIDAQYASNGDLVVLLKNSSGAYRIMKFAANGTRLWSQNVTAQDSAAWFRNMSGTPKLGVDSNGNSFVATEMTLPTRFVVTKYDTSGNYQWAKEFFTTPSAVTKTESIATSDFYFDNNGNIHVLAVMYGDFTNNVTLPYYIDQEQYAGVFKLSQAGSLLYKMQYVVNDSLALPDLTPYQDNKFADSTVFKLAGDSNGNVYIAGQIDTKKDPTCQATQVETSPGVWYVVSCTIGAVPFLTKLSSGGNILYSKKYDYDRSYRGKSVAVDASGNAYFNFSNYLAKRTYYDTDGYLMNFSGTLTGMDAYDRLYSADISTTKTFSIFDTNLNNLYFHQISGTYPGNLPRMYNNAFRVVATPLITAANIGFYDSEPVRLLYID